MWLLYSAVQWGCKWPPSVKIFYFSVLTTKFGCSSTFQGFNNREWSVNYINMQYIIEITVQYSTEWEQMIPLGQKIILPGIKCQVWTDYVFSMTSVVATSYLLLVVIWVETDHWAELKTIWDKLRGDRPLSRTQNNLRQIKRNSIKCKTNQGDLETIENK